MQMGVRGWTIESQKGRIRRFGFIRVCVMNGRVMKFTFMQYCILLFPFILYPGIIKRNKIICSNCGRLERIWIYHNLRWELNSTFLPLLSIQHCLLTDRSLSAFFAD